MDTKNDLMIVVITVFAIIVAVPITWWLCGVVDRHIDAWWQEEQRAEYDYWADCRVIKERWEKRFMVVPIPMIGWHRVERWCERDYEQEECKVDTTCEYVDSATKICTVVRWCEDK